MAEFAALKGAQELERVLKRASDAVARESLVEATAAGAKVIVDGARRRAAKDTGKGAESIHATVTERSRFSVTQSIGPSKNAFYMRFVEFGTVKTAARPFLRPALDEERDAVIRKVGRELWEQIRRRAR